MSTTVQIETANNTSAVDSFPGSYTGNAPAGNISKVAFKGLLGGHDVPVLAHLMPWWRKSGKSHPFGVTVGYDSVDPTQIARQSLDMLESDISGVMIDWYGRPKTEGSEYEDNVTHNWFIESGKHLGFKVCTMLDCGAYKADSITNKTAEFILCANYAADKYFGHPNYWRIGGRPVFPSFGDADYNLDWPAIRRNVKGEPLFIFRNSGGFSHAESDGAYSWTSQGSVLSAAAHYPNKILIASACPGFDDRLASWSKNRIILRANGQYWLDRFKEIKAVLDAGRRVDAIQLVTWNDYEEGSTMEPGVVAQLAAYLTLVQSDLQWSLSGNLNAVDHFVLFESPDGIVLNPVATLPPTQRSFDLGSLKLQGAHRFMLKVVAKSRIHNFLSRAVVFSPIAAPTVKLSIADGATVHNPVSVTATSNVTGRVEIWLDGTKADQTTGTSLTYNKSLSLGRHRIASQVVRQSDGIILSKVVANITVVA